MCEQKKKVLRTFYLDSLGSAFVVGKIEGKVPATPKVGETVSLDVVKVMVQNGNRIVLIPEKGKFRVYQDGNHESDLSTL